MASNKDIRGRLDADTQHIKSLIQSIDKGEIKVPQFQRPFVWKEEQALSLLDSLSNNYPIGSILLWKTKEKLSAERNIGTFNLPETDDLTPTDFVLDGQQRLTVIYASFGAKESDTGYCAGFDLNTETFVEYKTANSSNISIFPLRIIFQVTKLLNFRSGLEAIPNAKALQEKLDRLIDVISNYKLPVITLKDLSVEEVCPIFERINSSGTRLSTYDLMVAATWKSDFDLNSEIEVIKTKLKPKRFNDVPSSAILKCICAIRHTSIKKEDVIKLREESKQDMDKLVVSAGTALEKAVDLLSTEFGILSWDFIPYEAFLIIAAFIYHNSAAIPAANLVRVRKWFWSSAFSERYRGASEHYISKDLETISQYIAGNSQIQFTSIPTAERISEIQFRRANSQTKAFILLLARNRPKNLTNGAAIDIDEALSSYNKKQYHHINPVAFLGRKGIKNENCLSNLCMLSASENNAVSDDDPSAYLPKCIAALGANANDVLASNFLPEISAFNYSNIDYRRFIEARGRILSAELARLTS